jgi:hypothetical protein
MFPFAALAIALYFLVAYGIPSAYDLYADSPMIVTAKPMSGARDSKATHHIASDAELESNLIFTALSTLIVLGLVFYWKNEAIEVDQNGVRARDALNRIRFEAAWAEIERVEVERRQRAAEFVIRKGDSELSFSSDELNGYKELLVEIEGHAPQIDPTPIKAYLS